MHTMKFDNVSSEKKKEIQEKYVQVTICRKNLIATGTVAATPSVVENYGPILTKELRGVGERVSECICVQFEIVTCYI